MQGNTRCTLRQETQYPWSNETTMVFSLARPETFGVALRIPAWAGAKTRVSINGKRADVAITPDSFVTVRGTWKDGDRMEVEFEMPLRTEAVDAQHPELVALMHGPVALFAMQETDSATGLRQADLLRAKAIGSGSEWRVKADKGEVRLKPFVAIQSGPYQLYQKISV